MDRPPVIFSQGDLRELGHAKALLENPSFTVRLSKLIGAPIDAAMAMIPKPVHEKINLLANAALSRALQVAIATTRSRAKTPSTGFHKILAGASGGIGGAFGVAALAVELPVSTTIMLRSIVEIARSEGHDPALMETKLDCLAVFALNGAKNANNPNEAAYWVARLALQQSLTDAATFLAGKTVVDRSSPAVARLIGTIAARYGVLISEEAAAKAMPILGAVGGSVVNVIFMDHFQHMAHGHFIIRRLEKRYGVDEVRRQYGLA
jgi:hypothetical protein